MCVRKSIMYFFFYIIFAFAIASPLYCIISLRKYKNLHLFKLAGWPVLLRGRP